MLVATIVIAALLVAAIVTVNLLGQHTQAANDGPTAQLKIPLTASNTTTGAETVLLPMGDLNEPSNTFWELFVRSSAGTAWVLRTPPGVADNGGLAASLAPSGDLAAGFMASALLRFSPVAGSSNAGQTWSPGQLPGPLPVVANALAVNDSGAAVALVSSPTERVLSTSGTLSTWISLGTLPTTSTSHVGCPNGSASAVALSNGGTPYVGSSCARGGQIGIDVPGTASSASWHDVGPQVAGSPSGISTVLRLEGADGGLTGLAQVTSGSSKSILAFWGNGQSGHWSQSPRITVPDGWSTMATGIGGGKGNQGATLLLGSGRARRIESISGPGGAWHTLPTPPDGTSAVAGSTDEVDAFVASGAKLTIWSLPTGSTAWKKTTTTRVPIQYGSSS
jgi:hypothetical protein